MFTKFDLVWNDPRFPSIQYLSRKVLLATHEHTAFKLLRLYLDRTSVIYSALSQSILKFSPHQLRFLLLVTCRTCYSTMIKRPLPLTFEDRTSSITNTDFDDMYDRMFFHVARQPGRSTTKIYEMNIRASRHRSTLPLGRDPIIHLDFQDDESLGTISFFKPPFTGSIPMAKYLKKTSFFGTCVLTPSCFCYPKT